MRPFPTTNTTSEDNSDHHHTIMLRQDPAGWLFLLHRLWIGRRANRVNSNRIHPRKRHNHCKTALPVVVWQVLPLWPRPLVRSSLLITVCLYLILDMFVLGSRFSPTLSAVVSNFVWVLPALHSQRGRVDENPRSTRRAEIVRDTRQKH